MVVSISNEDQLFLVMLGERITRLRKAQSMTQLQMANVLNVSQQTIQAWEAGRRRIQIQVLPKVAELLSVTLDELFSEEPAKLACKSSPLPK